MTRLALLRHAPTAWNREKRWQGRADIPCLPDALAALRHKCLPAPYAQWQWFCSPLQRAQATAAALGIAAKTEPGLIESDWGDYEGITAVEAARRDGAAFQANEARGLDFLPPGGESPRIVQARLRPWLAGIGQSGKDTGAVTHKGVIRAILALAFDWPMLGKPPVRLDWTCLHVFDVDSSGVPRPGQMNIALQERA